MRVVSLTSVVTVSLLWLGQVESLAISSSRSSNKRRSSSSSQRSIGGGFGAKAAEVPTHTADASPTTKALVSFLTSQKSIGIGDDTDIGYSTVVPGLRGLYAKQSFKKGDILCRIPSDCALALSDPELGGSDVPSIAHGGLNFLRMYVKNEQAKKLWEPYLSTLPIKGEGFDPTPDFYTDQELEQLEFPRAIQKAKERREAIQQLAETEGMSMEELQFATWLVSSRSFSIQITAGDDSDELKDEKGRIITKPKNSIRVLVPYIDMINHSSDQSNAELHLIDPEKDDAWFAIRATRKIPAGKEVTISYGSGVSSSVEILSEYGFVPDKNRVDAYMLEKGGDDAIEDLSGWSTTLEEDLSALETAEGNMRNILALRIKLKQAYSDIDKK